jgi:hypothetical protein
MLLSVEGLDAVACGFVLSELRLVLGWIDVGLFVPQLSFKNVDLGRMSGMPTERVWELTIVDSVRSGV